MSFASESIFSLLNLGDQCAAAITEAQRANPGCRAGSARFEHVEQLWGIYGRHPRLFGSGLGLLLLNVVSGFAHDIGKMSVLRQAR
jgi:hypothetical protein